ncbi:hypothetical protein CBL_02999 [Carabus blaptoides fortunei]
MAQAFNDNEMARKLETVSLSHQTVSRRVDEISIHVTSKLENLVNNCCYFYVTLNDSTDISDTSQMLICIRTVNENYSYSEELLQLRALHGTTKGEDIYKELKCAIAQYGGFDKCTAIVTDGARAMTGKNIGLAGILQKGGINCRMLHCIVHQEALCGLSLKLRDVMDKENNLFHFESCKEIYEEMKDCNIEVNFEIFLPKLDMLIEDFNTRFSQFDDFKTSINLFSDPFNIDITSVDPKYQMELCDLQADPFIASSGATGIQMFKLLDKEKYPNMFGSTYICERAFSDMKYIKSKYRNSLKDSTLENIIRLATTNIDMDIKEIVAQQLRPQCSH